jgi:hypothetical protein
MFIETRIVLQFLFWYGHSYTRIILTKLWNCRSKATHGFWRHRGNGGKSSGFRIVQYAVSSIPHTLAQWIKLPEENAQAIEIGLPPERQRGAY